MRPAAGVTGHGFPNSVPERHAVLREALEIIRPLWRGGCRSYHGSHLRLATPGPSTCRRSRR